MRYSVEREQKARALAEALMRHEHKRYNGYAIERITPAYERDAIYGVTLLVGGEIHSRHCVELYRAERVFSCECTASLNGQHCTHVGLALIAHDADLELEQQEQEAEQALVKEVQPDTGDESKQLTSAHQSRDNREHVAGSSEESERPRHETAPLARPVGSFSIWK